MGTFSIQPACAS